MHNDILECPFFYIASPLSRKTSFKRSPTIPRLADESFTRLPACHRILLRAATLESNGAITKLKIGAPARAIVAQAHCAADYESRAKFVTLANARESEVDQKPGIAKFPFSLRRQPF